MRRDGNRRRGGVFTAIVALMLAGQAAAVKAPASAEAPWSGTVSLSVDRSTTDANVPSARLTLTVSQALRECPGLVGNVSGKDCDVYPFYPSGESWPGASLRPVDAHQHRAAGGRYGVFVTSCDLTSGGPAPETLSGSPFLVVPMAFPGAPGTLHFCRR